MKPLIICHMVSTIDGKINADAFDGIANDSDYETTAAKLKGDAWICGRVTMQHFAQRKPFVPASNKPAGPQPVFVARRAKSHAIAVDTRGTLNWRGGDLDGEHLICIVSEQAPADYLADLRKKKISHIVAGRATVDLTRAVGLLRKHFGIRRLLLEGGGRINGGFLAAGLIDELSLLVVPGIDGRHDIPTVFDGMKPAKKKAVPLKLKSVERLKRGTLWLRYKIAR
ncbi:2,5-diamino-6-(ribosylamino)-4(3H)-pyrimidinone 5'-phosphate reductase [Ereboglobus sp. PH5-10]|uniref:dihydrofolate reductase family protein n=1 Tax=Ereboglobus sp. PH5-10 TaxID=2940629 RepID=UPI002406C85A|nr:dihydrofolate reductase family protein [Ereboglobus sp. PH5-10]MDF9828049.1 2,5-diamino-6-(ribosylamino)-4(3H)-pyrimidinone 5'-phosphate reductase [Ereboglobus sp. PH5-10]